MVKTAYRLSFDKGSTRTFVGSGSRTDANPRKYDVYSKQAAEEQVKRIGSDKDARSYFKNLRIEKVKL